MGALIAAGFAGGSFDFYTHWQNAGLTTTLKEGPPGDEKRGVYMQRFPKLNFHRLGELHEKHEKKKAALEKKSAKKLGAKIATEATLRAYAEALDRGLARALGL